MDEGGRPGLADVDRKENPDTLEPSFTREGRLWLEETPVVNLAKVSWSYESYSALTKTFYLLTQRRKESSINDKCKYFYLFELHLPELPVSVLKPCRNWLGLMGASGVVDPSRLLRAISTSSTVMGWVWNLVQFCRLQLRLEEMWPKLDWEGGGRGGGSAETLDGGLGLTGPRQGGSEIAAIRATRWFV